MTENRDRRPSSTPERREGLYINTLVIPADDGAPLQQHEIPTHGLTEMQQLVGGLIQGIDLGNPPARLYCNEEGKGMELPPNKRATLLLWIHNPAFRFQDVIVGDAFVVGPAKRSADSGVPDEYVQALLESTSLHVELQTPGSNQWQQFPQHFGDWVSAYEHAVGWSAAMPNHVSAVRVVPDMQQ